MLHAFKIWAKFKPKKYTRNQNLYNNLSTLVHDNMLLESTSPILLKHIKFGDNFNSIKKKCSNYTLKFLKNNSEVKIMYFKVKLHDLKIYCKVHFYKNKVFLIQYKIPYITSVEKLKVYRFFNIKYLKQPYYTGKEIIKGKCGNLISISDNVNYTVEYIQQETLHLVTDSGFEAIYPSSIKRAYL